MVRVHAESDAVALGLYGALDAGRFLGPPEYEILL